MAATSQITARVFSSSPVLPSLPLGSLGLIAITPLVLLFQYWVAAPARNDWQSESLAVALGLLDSAIIKCVTYDELFNSHWPSVFSFLLLKKRKKTKWNKTKQSKHILLSGHGNCDSPNRNLRKSFQNLGSIKQMVSILVIIFSEKKI